MVDAERTTSSPRHIRMAWPVIILQFAWFAAITLARILIEADVVSPGMVTWLVAVVPAVLTPFLLRAYMAYIHALDELWIGIYLRALSLSFGVTVLFLLTYPVLVLAGAPVLDAFAYGAVGILTLCGAVVYFARRYS